jgi:hypothetical protein
LAIQSNPAGKERYFNKFGVATPPWGTPYARILHFPCMLMRSFIQGFIRTRNPLSGKGQAVFVSR